MQTLPSFLTSSKTALNNTVFCKLYEHSQFLTISGQYAELVVLSKYGDHAVLELTVLQTVLKLVETDSFEQPIP